MKIRLVDFRKVFILLSLITLMYSCGIVSNDSSFAEFHIDVNKKGLNFGDFVEGDVTYYDSTGLLIFKDVTTDIKYRGNASAHYDKRSFSLKFPHKKSFGNTKKNKSWKLNAEYIDKTFMRNKLSYDLFKRFSKGNISPNIMYIEVYINGDYNGLYALTEKVDEEKLGLKKKESVLFKEPPISNPPEIHNKKHEGMVNYSKKAPFYSSFSKSAMDKLLKRAYYNQRFPDINKNNKSYLIHEFSDFVFNSELEEFADPTLSHQYFEINNLIDWHILLLISNNSDGLLKNFYLFRKKEGYPFLFTPWDYDHGYGRDGDGLLNENSFLDISRMKLIVRLMETNAFNYRERLYQKFMGLKNGNILSDKNIYSMIDMNVSMIQDAVVRNELRWPLESLDTFKGASFTSEVELMKEWISIQLIVVEEYLLKLTSSPDQINILTGEKLISQ